MGYVETMKSDDLITVDPKILALERAETAL